MPRRWFLVATLCVELSVLALVTIAPHTPVDWVAVATVVNAILVVFLVAATVYYAGQTARTVEELQEGRLAQVLPMLRWDRPEAELSESNREDISVKLSIANIGPGPARIFDGDVKTVSGEKLLMTENPRLPLTLASGKTLAIEGIAQGEQVITVTLRYTDLLGLRSYETRILFRAFSRLAYSGAAYWVGDIAELDTDERSVLERRIDEKQVQPLHGNRQK